MKRIIPILVGLVLLPVISSCGESKAEKEARIAKEREQEIRIRIETEEKIRKENEEARRKEIEEARIREIKEREAALAKVYFRPGKSYTTSYVEDRAGDGNTWTRGHSVQFYEDGSFTWTETNRCHQDGRESAITYNGHARKVSRSYHDKVENWYEFEATTVHNCNRRYMYFSVDLDGNVYRGVTGRSFNNVPSETSVICKF